jgi:ankyrin repeat protein
MKKTLFLLLFALFNILSVAGQKNNQKLYQAIIKNDKKQVAKLLEDKADPNYTISSGSWMKVNMLITAVNNNDIGIVKLLIDKKADVNWKDGFNTTALMYAASKGNREIVKLLLENDADVNATDGQGNTVLSAAKESKNEEVIRIIEERLKAKN